MGIFDKIFGKRRDPSIVTKEIVDPIQRNLAQPLSEFLRERVGKGIEPFKGPVTGEFPKEGLNRFNEFLSLDSGEFFQEKVAGPVTARFKEDFLPIIREGFAGSLRGSGRFRTEEEQFNKLSQGLAETEAALALELPKAQFELSERFFKIKDLQAQRKLEQHLRELPEFNPILGQAIQFLSSAKTGLNILGGLDSGKSTSGFGDFLTLLVQGVTTVAAGG